MSQEGERGKGVKNEERVMDNSLKYCNFGEYDSLKYCNFGEFGVVWMYATDYTALYGHQQRAYLWQNTGHPGTATRR